MHLSSPKCTTASINKNSLTLTELFHKRLNTTDNSALEVFSNVVPHINVVLLSYLLMILYIQLNFTIKFLGSIGNNIICILLAFFIL